MFGSTRAAGSISGPEERACGFMFQDYALFPHLSAWRNVAFGMPGPRQGRRDARPGSAAALRCRASGRRPPRLPLGRRAPAGGPGAIAGPRPERPATRRTPLRSRHPHPRARRPRARRAHSRGTRALAIVVTHDFSEAAMLADEIFVMDERAHRAARDRRRAVGATRKRLRRRLRGLGGAQRHGPTGDGRVDEGRAGWRRACCAAPTSIGGPVAALVFPWEISLEPAGAAHESSALNRLRGRGRHR